MSRCFPYPPPGYEKKAGNDARSVHVDLLAKEKHIEKKHKKEKRDKEKRDGKKGKDKDQSKDKRKEKKDRKEKHKDKKKGKDKDKGGSRTFEDRAEKQIQSHNEHRHEGNWKTEEIKHSKTSDKLDCQIKNEEMVVANRMVGNFTSSVQRSFDGSGAEAAKGMERVASNKVIPSSVHSLPRRINGMARPADNFSSTVRNRTEVLGSANAVQKERSSTNKLVSNLGHLGKRGNGGKEQPVDNSMISIQERYATTAVEKENCKHNKVVANPSSKVQSSVNGMGQSAESLSILAHRKVDGIFLVKTIEDRGEIKKIVPSHIFLQQREEDGIVQPVEKDVDKMTEAKEKNREGEAYDRKEKRHKDRDRDKKKKKDKDRLNKKEKEQAKTREKGEQKLKEHDEIRDISKMDQIDIPNLELLASRRDQKKSNSTDEIKKRKELEMNGFLHENDSQPNKFQRTTAFHLVENGRIVDLSYVDCSSMKPELINSIRAGKLHVDSKEHIVNGKSVPQLSSDGLRHPAVVDNAKSQISLKAPHPDSMYLSEIYSVPKIDDLPECDDQEWLFGSCCSHPKPKLKLEADKTSQVWAEALRIRSEDVLALPYVIPF